MPDLIHLNGPPAVGKSTLAAALVRRRPLALNLDIDELRVRLGSWQDHDESKQVARDLAFRLAEWHLRSGRDVVMPQLLVRRDVVEQLEALAVRAGASFFEVILMAPASTCIQRVGTQSGDHPRRAFSDTDLAARIEYSCGALLRLGESWAAALLVRVEGDADEAAGRVELMLRDGASPRPD